MFVGVGEGGQAFEVDLCFAAFGFHMSPCSGENKSKDVCKIKFYLS